MEETTTTSIKQQHENPLLRLEGLGQSIWLDFISRGLITSGKLKRFIDEDGLTGVTANPSIFEKAIAGSHDYDDAIQALPAAGRNTQEIYETLAVEDVRAAADLMRPVHDARDGGDGYVSLEVSPRLAHDTAGTIAEARRFWRALDRPNVLIKVPGTRAGLGAIRQLTSEGININVTLLFGLPRYREVTEAYISGLEDRIANRLPVNRIHSVASFFLSRIDVLVDPQLEKMMSQGGANTELATSLRGKAAIASAKLAYQMYLEIFKSKRFLALADHGAATQRVLWASTSTKNPSYDDLMYVEPLIGPHTINTVPLETLEAYRDHGKPAVTLEDGVPAAREVLQKLGTAGIDIDQVTQQLEDEGVRKFDDALTGLLAALEQKRARVR